MKHVADVRLTGRWYEQSRSDHNSDLSGNHPPLDELTPKKRECLFNRPRGMQNGQAVEGSASWGALMRMRLRALCRQQGGRMGGIRTCVAQAQGRHKCSIPPSSRDSTKSDSPKPPFQVKACYVVSPQARKRSRDRRSAPPVAPAVFERLVSNSQIV